MQNYWWESWGPGFGYTHTTYKIHKAEKMPICCFTRQCLQWPRQGQGQSRKPGTHSRSPTWWQEPSCLTITIASQSLQVQEAGIWSQSLESNSGTLLWDTGFSISIITAKLSTHSRTKFWALKSPLPHILLLRTNVQKAEEIVWDLHSTTGYLNIIRKYFNLWLKN